MLVVRRGAVAAVAFLLGLAATLPAQTSDVWTRSYDVRNRLSEIRRGADILLRLEYDPESRLSKKIGAEGVRQYVYDGANLIAEYDGDGNELVRYDWAPGPYGRDQIIRYTLTSVPGRPNYYPAFDGHGSVTGLADAEGRPVAAYHLDAWGSFRFPGEINASTNRFAYTAYRYMPEAGLYFAVSRFYDPSIGRFLTRDTYLGDIEDVPTLHRYGYARNNPTGYIDPDGHESFRQWIGLDKPTASVEREFLKNFGYDAWNAVSFGALVRQDSLVEKSEAGLISEGQYLAGTGINLGGTLAAAAGSAYTGGAVGRLVGGSLRAAWAAGGASAGFVGASGNAALDVGTGARRLDQVTAGEIALGTVVDGVLGGIGGAAAMEGTPPFSRSPAAPRPPSTSTGDPMTVVEGRAGAELVPTSQARLPSYGAETFDPPSTSPTGAIQTAPMPPTISRLARRGFLEFEGLEVRGARDLSHISEGTLKAMAKRGFAATDAQGQPIVLHHLEQNAAGPLVEMPANRHRIGNPRQHPLGNTPGVGLTPAERAAFNAWRVEYWKARALEELARRGIQ